MNWAKAIPLKCLWVDDQFLSEISSTFCSCEFLEFSLSLNMLRSSGKFQEGYFKCRLGSDYIKIIQQ